MNYTFEPYREDGSPRKFVGLFRPPYSEVHPGYLPTYHEKPHLESWTLGRFDRPLYEDDGTQNGTPTETDSDDPQKAGSKPEPKPIAWFFSPEEQAKDGF